MGKRGEYRGEEGNKLGVGEGGKIDGRYNKVGEIWRRQGRLKREGG